ncbi:uncharacterized protein LOC119163754 [Rhipicephalus microplus]|uniref:uncharacterized protein LOC119163754 n=1 Tax=Rhipicephalus microplus TaxID=6941 RepID=UPI001887AD92|nr:uncharacterized protein LOC119163754 [Rhipicephalus microplus]
MAEPEQSFSQTELKWPFRQRVLFKTSMLDKRRVPVDAMKSDCRTLLQVAQGRVLAANPEADSETKQCLIDTSEQILSCLDKGLQLRVLDPHKLPAVVENNRPMLKRLKEKNEQLEKTIKKAKALRDELMRQGRHENGDVSTEKISSDGPGASGPPDKV